MRAWWTCVVLGVLLILGAAGRAQAQTARAVILKDVVVDGRLDDWPDDLERYPIRNNYQCYGRTDIDRADLSTSADFSPHFRVAYNPDENLVYVAVETRDEELVVGDHYLSTDACEIFVHGPGTRSRGNPFQYTLVPGHGSYVQGWGNPGLKDRDIARTRTRGAFTREGDVTAYEWAVEVFDEFPNRPTTLSPGKTIGFDVVAVDKDGHGTAALIPWGPPMRDKYFHPDRLGNLVLLDASASQAALSMVTPEFVRGMHQAGLSDLDVEELLELKPVDMSQFGQDMAKFGEDMARLATEMAVLELEKARPEVEKAKREVEKARRELKKELKVTVPFPTPVPAPVVVSAPALALFSKSPVWSKDVVEDIVDILGAAFIILCIGFVVFLVRRARPTSIPPEIVDELAERLETIERRLTDTQDVMIALSEKYDRLEDRYRNRQDNA